MLDAPVHPVTGENVKEDKDGRTKESDDDIREYDLELGTQELLDALEHQYTSLHTETGGSENGYGMQGRR